MQKTVACANKMELFEIKFIKLIDNSFSFFEIFEVSNIQKKTFKNDNPPINPTQNVSRSSMYIIGNL